MPRRRYQALAVALALVLATNVRAFAQAPTTRPANDSAELRAAADELLRSAVRSHFGWGWRGNSSEPTVAPAQRSRAARQPVEIDLRATAAAGLLLHLAAESLNEPTYREGAMQAARAVMAVQQRLGQIPRFGTIAVKPAAPFDPAVVPDRSATIAALGLLLSLVEAPDPSTPADPRLSAAATRAAHWLATQQTDAGAWPSFYPGDGPGQATRRIVRLDGPGYRDATLALILSSRVLGRNDLQRAAVKAIDELLRFRVSKSRSPGRGLWTPAFTLGGEPVHGLDEFPAFIHTPASAYGMDTLLAAAIGMDDEESAKALTLAAESAGKLPRHDGQWDRWYDLYLRKLDVPQMRPRDPTQPTEAGDNPFNLEPDPNAPADQGPDPNRGDFGMSHTLAAARRITALGIEPYRARLEAELPLNRRMALVLVGLPAELLTAGPPRFNPSSPDVDPALPHIVVQGVGAWIRSNAD